MTNHRPNFEMLWREIQRGMSVGDTIKNWTRHSGYIDGEFTISAMGTEFVEIDSPAAKNFQRVLKKDFEDVYGMWDGYVTGRVHRYQIRDATRFSKYIISILYHVTQDG